MGRGKMARGIDTESGEGKENVKGEQGTVI